MKIKDVIVSKAAYPIVDKYDTGEVLTYCNSFVAHCVECGDWYRSYKTKRAAISAINSHNKWTHQDGPPSWATNW